MGSLEPLRNPVTRTTILRNAVNLIKNPITNEPVWNVALQYFSNDLVISPVNSGAYVFWGGRDGLTSIRGGNDPSDNPEFWWRLTQTGVQDSATVAPEVSAGDGVYTVTGESLTDAAPNGVYLVVWQGTATGGSDAGSMSAADIATWTITPTGAGAVPQVLTVSPTVGAASHSWGMSATVVVGDATEDPTNSIAITGAYAGTAQAITPRVTYIRLS